MVARAENVESIRELEEYVAKHKLPRKKTKEKEYFLIKSAQEGDKKAVEELILSHLYLIVLVIKTKKWNQSNISAFDLLQVAIERFLEKELPRFCFNKNVRFSTPLFWGIRSAISRYIGNENRTVRIPMHQNEAMFMIVRKIPKNHSESFEVAFMNSAKKLGFCQKKAEESFGDFQSIFSLNSVVRKDSSDEFIDFEVSIIKSPEGLAEENDLKKRLSFIFNNSGLSSRDKKIMKMRKGVGEYKKRHSLKEVGDFFNLSDQRVYQIETENFPKIIKKITKLGEEAWL